MLKKILFILQKSYYGLECKLATGDCWKATSRRRQRPWPSSLYDRSNLLSLGLSTPEGPDTEAFAA